MTAYDEKDVPILDFHNPAGAIYYPNGLYTYAMGNTRQRSITEQIGTTNEQHLDLLFLACGDLRNALCTVSELSQRKPDLQPKTIDIHLNDYDRMILPRNAIILDIITHIDPDVPDDVDFLWNVWYNMTLSESHRERLRQVISSLIDKNFDDNDGTVLRFQDGRTEEECRAVWKDWLDLNLDVKTVKQERDVLNSQKGHSIKDFTQNIMTKIAMVISENLSGLVKESNPLHQEVKRWFVEGTTTDDNDAINPTLIRPFVHEWKIHYSSCPFEGYLPFQRADITKCKSLAAVCKENLKSWVKRFQYFKKQHPIKVSMWAGDALWLCTSGLPSEMLFDVIDTSNASDHIGLLNVLVCCGPRLKCPLVSQLQTSSIKWFTECESTQEYYDQCIGINTNLLPTVLGLHLAVDLDLGSRNLPDNLLTSEECLYWVKADTERTPLMLDKESDIVTALWNLTKRCFNLIKNLPDGQAYGASVSSPLTLLRIVHQMSPLVKGGDSRILDLLENKMTYEFHQAHGFTWRLAKSIAKHDADPVLEIKVSLQVSVSGLFEDTTPIPMLVILEKEHMQTYFTHFEGCPVIYNSLRFNANEGTVTFHMLEEDWNIIKAKSLLRLVQCRKSFIFFCCEPVDLQDDDKTRVRRVDPVATFGLFGVQTFFIEDTCPSSLLKVTKVEEEDNSYRAELAILDSDKCNAKDMKIEFTPESSSTGINITFLGINGCKMKFSCPVCHSSKFQLSRKLGRIVCHIPKKEKWVTGELALRNPAKVPFYAMKKWDAQSDDIEIVCGKMFRSNRDLQLKSSRETGYPFYALRESIGIILQKELKPKSQPVAYSVEDDDHIKSLIMKPDDILLKNGLVIKVKEPVYKWNNIPYAKCIFYDCKQHSDIIKTNPSKAQQMALEFWQEPHDSPGIVQRIPAEPEEIDLFRRMMYINAARTEQEKPAISVFKDSFICTLFPRDAGFKQDAVITDFMKGIASLNDLLGSSSSLFPSQQLQTLQEARDSSHSAEMAKPAKRQKLDRCAFCQKTSGDLKKCMRCKKVSYCNRDCQKQHWKTQHKRDCSASSL